MRKAFRAVRHSFLLTGALLPLWLALILILPTVPAPASQAFYPETLDMANLEAWHYSIAQFEMAAIRDVLQRTRLWFQPRLSSREQQALVRDYMATYRRQQEAAREFAQASDLLAPLDLARQAHAAETWLQLQAALYRDRNTFERAVHWLVTDELARAGLTVRTRTFPPVLFRLADPPLLLTISPRDEIRSIVAVYVQHNTPVEEIESYEEYMRQQWDMSAYVSPVGGVATYPTTVTTQFRDLALLFNIVAHEWVHTYFAFRPLGVRYFRSADFRTLNETAATIVGEEISQRIMLRHFRDLVPAVSAPADDAVDSEETAFDFRVAMHETRRETDHLLALGQIEAAEAYMEERRRRINAAGYNLRKLNQAYFAFHGTYATSPGSTNPIGPLMTELRALTPNLRDFVALVEAFDEETDLLDVLAVVRYRLTDLEDPYA